MTVKNTHMAQALIEGCVLKGIDPGKAFMELRNVAGFQEMLSSSKENNSRKQTDDYAETFAERLKEADRRGPLVRKHIELQHLSGALVGDVMALLAEMPSENPRDVRDVIDMISGLERLQSARQAEGSLADALEMLEAAKVDVTELRSRFEALFPPAPKVESKSE